jgi:MFS family permease
MNICTQTKNICMRKWLKILIVADFFVSLGIGMITPIYAIFVENIGGDILAASSAWAVFAFSSGALMYVFGRWEDRKKYYSEMLFIAYLIQTFAFLGYMFVGNVIELLAVQLMLGISNAIIYPTADTLYSKHLDKGRDASEWGIWEGMDMIGAAVAALIGGIIANFFGFRSLFIVMFIFGIVGTAISSLLLSKKANINKN